MTPQRSNLPTFQRSNIPTFQRSNARTSRWLLLIIIVSSLIQRAVV